MPKLYIPVLAGTTREQRKSIYAARLVAEVGNTFDGVETEVIDPKDFILPALKCLDTKTVIKYLRQRYWS